jgi:TetR/AcrR family transcriptional repressor of bet genes
VSRIVDTEPPSDGREARGDATRNELIDAVITAVARHGLEGTTISRLIEITGASRGLISFHFDGKEKLLEAALQRAIGIYEKSWEQSVVERKQRPAVERLHAAIEHDLDFAVTHGDILSFWWAAWAEVRAKETYARLSAARDRQFVADLKRLFMEAGLKGSAAGQSALLVNACLLGFWQQFHCEGEMADMKAFRRAGRALVDQCLGRAAR